jgi:hypothetical protein
MAEKLSKPAETDESTGTLQDGVIKQGGKLVSVHDKAEKASKKAE